MYVFQLFSLMFSSNMSGEWWGQNDCLQM